MFCFPFSPSLEYLRFLLCVVINRRLIDRERNNNNRIQCHGDVDREYSQCSCSWLVRVVWIFLHFSPKIHQNWSLCWKRKRKSTSQNKKIHTGNFPKRHQLDQYSTDSLSDAIIHNTSDSSSAHSRESRCPVFRVWWSVSRAAPL